MWQSMRGARFALAAEAGHGPAQRSLGLFYAQFGAEGALTARLAQAALGSAAADAPAATALAALDGAGQDTRPPRAAVGCVGSRVCQGGSGCAVPRDHVVAL